MSGDRSLGYCSRETINSSYCRRNYDGISDDKIIELSLVDGRRGHRSLETSHSSSHVCRGSHSTDNGRCGSRSQETSHYLSRNCWVYNFSVYGIVVTSYQETIHSSSCDFGARVDVYRRGGYRSHTSYSSSRFSGVNGIFSGLSFPSHSVYKHVHEDYRGGYSGYRSEKVYISFDDGDGRRNISRDDGDFRVDIIVDGGRCGSRSKCTSHFSSRNIGETAGGGWRCGYRSHNRYSFCHNPCGHGILLCISGASRHVGDILH